MHDRKANYEIVSEEPDVVTIRDLGPHDQFMTVTNAAEEVVAELFQSGILKDGQRLYYYDSSGDLDEIVVENRKFRGFQVGPRTAAEK